MKPKLERFIFVNRFYWPDEPATAQLLTDLASTVAARRHEVFVIASQSNSSLPLREVHRNVTIIRVPSTRWGKGNLLKRLVDLATFLFGVPKAIASIAKPGDLIISLTDPPLLGVVVHLMAYLYEARCIHWVQDIFPELAMVLSKNPLFHVAGFFAKPLRNLTWRKATACVTLGHDMAGVLKKAGVDPAKITIVPNWAPEGLSPQPASTADELRTEWGLTGKFVIAYSGNLGRIHDLDAIVDVAAALSADPDFVFVFIGNGVGRPGVERAVQARGLRNVQFHSPQSRARLSAALALGDVHLVTLREPCKDFAFPSKVYGIAAVGRPLLFIGPPYCDPAQLITSDGFGFAFARGEISKITSTLRDLRAQPALVASLGVAAAQASQRYGGAAAAADAWELLTGCKPLATDPARPISSTSP